MSGFPVLDVAIGLSFLYLLFALCCTTLNEVIAGLFKKRARMLRQAIEHLLGDKGLADKVYTHPAIVALAPPTKKPAASEKPAQPSTTREAAEPPKKEPQALPSYIPKERFAAVLADRLTGEQPLTDATALLAGIKETAAVPRQQLQFLFDLSKGDPDAFRANVAEWYEQTMDRAGGWYKRSVQRQTYVMAIVLVFFLNLDSIALFNRLWSDSAFRTAVVEQAKARVEATGTAEVPVMEYTEGDKPEAGAPVQTGTSSLTDSETKLLSSLGGWKQEKERLAASRVLRGDGLGVWFAWLASAVWGHLLGWMVTVLAISLGAPFWFDILNKIMNLRNAGRATDEARSKA
jgi:hypothetical protein